MSTDDTQASDSRRFRFFIAIVTTKDQSMIDAVERIASEMDPDDGAPPTAEQIRTMVDRAIEECQWQG